MAEPIRLFFDHDGAVDDLLSLVLLCGIPHIELLGIGVTPADCILASGVEATLKLLELNGMPTVSVASGSIAVKNDFPSLWRHDSERTVALPVIRSIPLVRKVEPIPAHQLLVNILRAEIVPITVLFTGPLTNLAAALTIAPEIESKIKRLYWMGGALDVAGNVQRESGDRIAEWNAYADPVAARRVWESAIPITMVSLDVTNHLPVTKEFIDQIGALREFKLANTLWHLWTYAATGEYFLWDPLATLLMAFPTLARYENRRCEVVLEGPEEGRTKPVKNGRMVTVPVEIDPPRIYEAILQLIQVSDATD